MKTSLPALAWLIFASLMVSCASTQTASERAETHAQGSDDELDDDAGTTTATGGDSALDDQLDSGMGTQTASNHAAQSSGLDDNINDFSSAPRTRYAVLSNGFDLARAMPSVNDFDPLDDPSPRLSCLSVKAADPNNVSEVVLKQMMVQISGTADYGPLLPGSFDHVETRLVIGKNNGWVNSQNLTNEMRQVFELSKAPGSLVIRITPNKFGIYQDIGAPAEIWIRKDMREHLFFKVYRLDAQRNRSEVFIGYCFQRGGTPSITR